MPHYRLDMAWHQALRKIAGVAAVASRCGAYGRDEWAREKMRLFQLGSLFDREFEADGDGCCHGCGGFQKVESAIVSKWSFCVLDLVAREFGGRES